MYEWMSKVNTAKLLELARGKSAAGRQFLAETIADMVNESDRKLNDREKALMYEILRHLVHETDKSVRQIVSSLIAEQADAPRELVNILANDDIEVAFPILTKSNILNDHDLMEVIRHRALEHQMAVALRNSITEEVSQSLVENGNENVIVTLLKNSGAEISHATMEYLVDESERIDAYQEPILRRDDLDPELAKKMIVWVSAALREFIISKFNLSRIAVDDILEQATHKGIKRIRRHKMPSKADILASTMDKQNIITSESIVRTLEDGQVHLFISMFRQQTGLRNNLVTRILLESSGEGLSIACRAIGLSMEQFRTIFRLSGKARIGSEKTLDKDETVALKFYDEISSENAKKVVTYWRRDVDYLAAIRELEITQQAAADKN